MDHPDFEETCAFQHSRSRARTPKNRANSIPFFPAAPSKSERGRSKLEPNGQ